MKYKLGLDLGSTSLGWAVVELDDDENITNLVDMGVSSYLKSKSVRWESGQNTLRSAKWYDIADLI